jgi:hypothetical protein
VKSWRFIDRKIKEVKNRCRADKKQLLEGKVAQAEEVAGRNDPKMVCQIVRNCLVTQHRGCLSVELMVKH